MANLPVFTSMTGENFSTFPDWPCRHGINHPPPSSAEVKKRVQPNLYSTSGPSWPVTG